MKPPVRVMVLAVDAEQLVDLSSHLDQTSFVVDPHSDLRSALDAIRSNRPDVVVCNLAGLSLADLNPLTYLTRAGSIPNLAVVARPTDLASQIQGFDDWIHWDQRQADLPVRVSRSARHRSDQTSPQIDPRFLALVVHDLRTPLNVINLTVRAIGQSVKSPGPDFDEDLTFLLENARQIERMLAQLGDYCRLIEGEGQLNSLEFQTRRFLTDFLEEKQMKRDSEFKAVRLEIQPDTPEVVELDATRARVALHHVLANALAAATESPVRLRSRGSDDQWIIEVFVDKAPPPTVAATPLAAHVFERLIGSNAERRGLDLAIAARVSNLFGGSARLDVEPGVRSIVTLIWPVRPRPTS